jgi:hypothetical protein
MEYVDVCLEARMHEVDDYNNASKGLQYSIGDHFLDTRVQKAEG